MTRIEIHDKNHDICIKITPIKATKPHSDYTEIKKMLPDLADCIVTRGSTCVVYYANDDAGNRYLVKQFTVEEGSSPSLEINRKISQYYNGKGSNYFLKQAYVGTDGVTQYHLFEAVNGSTLTCESPVMIKDFLRIFKEYKGFVESLDALHQLGYIHFDVKSENIFRFKANESDHHIMQVLDFGSACLKSEVIENLKTNGESGYIYANTPEWYDEDDKALLCQGIRAGDTSLSCVLDLTAAVKVLCYLVCGEIDGFDFGYISEGKSKYEGIISKLYEMWDRATSCELAKRYVNCSDLIRDIDVLIESIEGNIKNPESLRLASKNTLIEGSGEQGCYDKLIADLKKEYFKEHRELKSDNGIRIGQLLEEINSDLLSYICVENDIYGCIGSSTPIESYLNRSRDKCNVLLFGNGGGGKSTALRALYLKSLSFKKGKTTHLYLSGEDFKNGEVSFYEKKIISVLNNRYKNCNVGALIENSKTNLIILFDTLDEIPDEIADKIFEEIGELSRLSNRFIMTSRESVSIRSAFAGTVTGEFLPLLENQISAVAPSVLARKDKRLIELLRSPMLMSIFLKLNNSGPKHIHTAEDLIKAYLRKIYNSCNRNGSEPLFNKHIGDVAEYCVRKYAKDDAQLAEAKAFIKNNKLDHIIRFTEYNETESVNGSNDNRDTKYYRAVFSHKLYEDYFKSIWLLDFFSESMKNERVKIHHFYFDESADIKRNLSPYWIGEIKKRFIKKYFNKGDNADGEKNDEIYSAVNNFIRQLDKADINQKQSGAQAKKHIEAIKNIINIVVLCCDGNLADINENKTLVNWGSLTKYFFTLVDFENVKSAFIPWNINVRRHMKDVDLAARASESSYSEYREGEQTKSMECALYSKHLVVSSKNIFCKSKKGSLYSKNGRKLICATRPISEDGVYEISENVRSISKSAFKYCVCKEFKVNNDLYFEKDGILYEKKTKKLIKYPIHKEIQKFELIDAENVSPYAFANAINLKSVDLTQLKSKAIPSSIFENSNIENVDLPNGISCIGSRAFYGCNRLTSLKTVADNSQASATFILNKAFYGCAKLTDLSGINNIKYIGSLALAETKSLEQLPISNKYWYIAKNAFENSCINQPPLIEKT